VASPASFWFPRFSTSHACTVSALLLLSVVVLSSGSSSGFAASSHSHPHHEHAGHSGTGDAADAPNGGAMHMMMQMYFEVRMPGVLLHLTAWLSFMVWWTCTRQMHHLHSWCGVTR